MNFMNHLDFETVEQGEINVLAAEKLRDSMGGDLYWNACNEDVNHLKDKLFFMKLKEAKQRANNQQAQS